MGQRKGYPSEEDHRCRSSTNRQPAEQYCNIQQMLENSRKGSSPWYDQDNSRFAPFHSKRSSHKRLGTDHGSTCQNRTRESDIATPSLTRWSRYITLVGTSLTADTLFLRSSTSKSMKYCRSIGMNMNPGSWLRWNKQVMLLPEGYDC